MKHMAWHAVWTRWLHLGYDREVLDKHWSGLTRSNLYLQRTVCGAVIVGIFLVNALLALGGFSLARVISSVALIAALSALYELADRLLRGGEPFDRKAVNAGLALTSLLLYGIAAYLGALSSQPGSAPLAALLICLTQIAFALPPLKSLMMALAGSAAIPLLSLLSKSPAPLGLACTALSLILGLLFSWHGARLRLTGLVCAARLKEAENALQSALLTDPLTGLNNRARMLSRFEQLREKSVRDDRSIACLLLDVDDFNRYNHLRGCAQGDRALSQIGALLNHYSLLNGICVGRIGGDEFMAVWREDALLPGESVAESLRLAVRDLRLGESDVEGGITVSLGLVTAAPDVSDPAERTVDALYRRADQALREAKEHGGNCCWRYRMETDACESIYANP